MKQQVRRRLVTMAAMLASMAILMHLQSCNGCSCVTGKVDGNVNINAAKTSGAAVIMINGIEKIAPQGENKVITVTFTGVQSGGTEGTGETSFSTSKSVEIRNGAANPAPNIKRYNLKPGSWTITVTAGSWTTTCVKSIGADASVSFTFNFNQNGCM
jgi:hypothetical protein